MKTAKQLDKEYNKRKKQFNRQLEQKYKKDLKKIQDACNHLEISGWQEEYEMDYDNVINTGREIRYCNKCSKTMFHRPLTSNKDVFRLGVQPEQNNK